MSTTGSYTSDHSAFSNGLNPMYQSLSTGHTQSEYDVVVHDNTMLQPPLPPRVTTANSLYSSKSELLKHPTLKHPTLNSHQGEFRFTSIPETKHYDDEKDKSCCFNVSCLFNFFVFFMSFVSILLSVSVIVICLLHWRSVITIISPTIPSTANNSATVSPPINNTGNDSCYCKDFIENYTYYNELLMDLEMDIKNISSELILVLEELGDVPQSSTDRLSVLSSSIQSINNTIQQLRIQATNTCSILSQLESITEPVELEDLGNQTCPVNTTKLNQPATVTIDNDCTIRTGTVCTTSLSCFTFNVVKFIQDNQILVDFECYVESSSNIVNGTAVVRQDSILNTTSNQDLYAHFVQFSFTTGVGCSCLSLGGESMDCNFIAEHCNYKRETVNSVINT